MTVALGAAAGILGLLIGSFLNVVIHRVPRGESVVSPASACPGCGTPIRRRDNVPVLSWLLLRGRCRDCRMGIPARYPLIELGTAIFFAVTAVRFAGALVRADTGTEVAAEAVVLVAYLYLAAISVALATIDLETHRLPNAIVLPAYVVGIAALAVAALLTPDAEALLRAGVGAMAMGGVYLAMAVLFAGGMGFGDVKLAGVLGLFLGWLGWGELLVGFFAAFVLGGVYSVILLASRRAHRRTGIPFGPWMLGGAWLGIFFGSHIWTAYLRFVGLG
ncbi:prepilin peptidase [Planctomonas psychrotolerans]|uniref:prepilin peptidase n=1 Tax=Planctomonas psychrotolerans TaxID=2528712 RepID=UPI00123B9637|nr:A24 family peptidase [Planctomonas psychrotolerans]